MNTYSNCIVLNMCCTWVPWWIGRKVCLYLPRPHFR